eukprot:360044-Chlamydomonas_euryale.AAC.3
MLGTSTGLCYTSAPPLLPGTQPSEPHCSSVKIREPNSLSGCTSARLRGPRHAAPPVQAPGWGGSDGFGRTRARSRHPPPAAGPHLPNMWRFKYLGGTSAVLRRLVEGAQASNGFGPETKRPRPAKFSANFETVRTRHAHSDGTPSHAGSAQAGRGTVQDTSEIRCLLPHSLLPRQHSELLG